MLRQAKVIRLDIYLPAKHFLLSSFPKGKMNVV